MSTPHAAAPEVFDELDPHGMGAYTKHSHHIVSGMTLKSILIILLAFTAITVGAAQAEKFIETSLHIELPRWVNVIVAMSIATVKASLVLMFFMLLRYSNPINTVVFLFCLLAFALFLFFTLLDLGTRGMINPIKAHQVEAGGIGGIRAGWRADAPIINQAPVVFWRERKIAEVGIDEYNRMKSILSHPHEGHGAPAVSSGNMSINRPGITPGLFSAVAPAAHDEHAPHGASPAPHGAPDAPAHSPAAAPASAEPAKH
ncbi:MAG: cytochrome C oxidase subunit IV family protein [Phycisphaeraceae bacterium]|nr:cytochrome C oxidase subunit IV family protein [Phycisphaeraceae bacterium]